MLGRRYMLRMAFSLVCVFLISFTSAYAQGADRNRNIAMSLGNFSVPDNLWTNPAWVLSSFTSSTIENKTSILSQFYPLWQEKLASGKFEQIQSIVIPGGIIDVINNLIYMENSANDIAVLDIKTGKIIRRINNICCPIAVVDNALLALSRTKGGNQFSYDLIMFDSNNKRSKSRWGTISLPDWLELPADGERQKFIFNPHCYNYVLSVAWQASRRQLFPNPLSLIIPAMAQPIAMQGNFSCDLKSQTIVSQMMKEGDANFLGYLTANENLPSQVALDSDTIAIRKYNYYLFLLIRSFPPENNISKAGVVAKRELRVKDMRNGKILWSYVLPAAFTPIAY